MVIAFFNKETKMNLTPIFNQYLKTTSIPELTYKINGDTLTYSWTNVNDDFNMPIDFEYDKKIIRLLNYLS